MSKNEPEKRWKGGQVYFCCAENSKCNGLQARKHLERPPHTPGMGWGRWLLPVQDRAGEGSQPPISHPPGGSGGHCAGQTCHRSEEVPGETGLAPLGSARAFWGVPIGAQRKQIRLGTMKLWVPSLDSFSGFRIWPALSRGGSDPTWLWRRPAALALI